VGINDYLLIFNNKEKHQARLVTPFQVNPGEPAPDHSKIHTFSSTE